jgi:hypothetical protein
LLPAAVVQHSAADQLFGAVLAADIVPSKECLPGHTNPDMVLQHLSNILHHADCWIIADKLCSNTVLL